jgi:hypothetical protein
MTVSLERSDRTGYIMGGSGNAARLRNEATSRPLSARRFGGSEKIVSHALWDGLWVTFSTAQPRQYWSGLVRRAARCGMLPEQKAWRVHACGQARERGAEDPPWLPAMALITAVLRDVVSVARAMRRVLLGGNEGRSKVRAASMRSVRHGGGAGGKVRASVGRCRRQHPTWSDTSWGRRDRHAGPRTGKWAHRVMRRLNRDTVAA